MTARYCRYSLLVGEVSVEVRTLTPLYPPFVADALVWSMHCGIAMTGPLNPTVVSALIALVQKAGLPTMANAPSPLLMPVWTCGVMSAWPTGTVMTSAVTPAFRSEERRVGKEGGS